MVCKKDTSDLYWFGQKNALRPVGEVKLILSCTEVLAAGVTSGREREVFPDLKMRVKCVCNSETSQGPEELCVCACVCFFL
jgi:hypothetical protein